MFSKKCSSMDKKTKMPESFSGVSYNILAQILAVRLAFA